MPQPEYRARASRLVARGFAVLVPERLGHGATRGTCFSPALSRQMAGAFRGGGGKVEFRLLPAYGNEGHWLAETDAGVNSAGAELDRALKLMSPAEAEVMKKR